MVSFGVNLRRLINKFLVISDKAMSLKANKMKLQLVLKLSTSMELQ